MKDFEGVGVEGVELIGFFWGVDKKDFQLSMMYRAVLIPAEVGVFKGVLVRNVNAAVGDEDCEPMRRVGIGAEERGE